MKILMEYQNKSNIFSFGDLRVISILVFYIIQFHNSRTYIFFNYHMVYLYCFDVVNLTLLEAI